MTAVYLHIYDVTNSGSDKADNAVVQINKVFKDRIGLGGIFHCAVEVHRNVEWSFRFSENGTGVFSCPAGKNPMYTYRERILLGRTNCSIVKVNDILNELRKTWHGRLYNMLSRNCNRFCDEFCEMLGVSKLPGWVNRFDNVLDTAAEKFTQAKTGIATGSKVAYKAVAGIANFFNPPKLQGIFLKKEKKLQGIPFNLERL